MPGRGGGSGGRLNDEMVRRGVGPNAVTYALLMQRLCNIRQYEDAKKMMFDMAYRGCQSEVVNYSVLMSACARHGDVNSVKVLLLEMCKRKLKPDDVCHDILIKCLCDKGRAEEAHKALVEMQLKGTMPGAATYRVKVDGSCRAHDFGLGLRVFNATLASRHYPLAHSTECLVKGLHENCKMEEAFLSWTRCRKGGCCWMYRDTLVLLSFICTSNASESKWGCLWGGSGWSVCRPGPRRSGIFLCGLAHHLLRVKLRQTRLTHGSVQLDPLHVLTLVQRNSHWGSGIRRLAVAETHVLASSLRGSAPSLLATSSPPRLRRTTCNPPPLRRNPHILLFSLSCKQWRHSGGFYLSIGEVFGRKNSGDEVSVGKISGDDVFVNKGPQTARSPAARTLVTTRSSNVLLVQNPSTAWFPCSIYAATGQLERSIN